MVISCKVLHFINNEDLEAHRPKFRSKNSKFISLDRFTICRAMCRALTLNLDRKAFCHASCQALMNNFSSLVSYTNLHGFNTWLEQYVSWSTKLILDLPNYK